MAHDAHGCCGDNLVELEAQKCLEPSPEQEVCFIEDHPRDEDRAEQADDRRTDGSIGNDDADKRRQNAEDDLNCVSAEQLVWFSK